MRRSAEEIEAIRKRYPNLPEHAIAKTRKKRKTVTGELTYQIIQHIKAIGGQCYRINSQGQYDPGLKKFRPSYQKKGLPDLQIIYQGKYIGCEVKAQKTDKLSSHQKERKSEIESAGGFFIEARNFDQFKTELQKITG